MVELSLDCVWHPAESRTENYPGYKEYVNIITYTVLEVTDENGIVEVTDELKEWIDEYLENNSEKVHDKVLESA